MLRGERLLLRAWHPGDIDALAALRNDVALQELLMANARPNSPEAVRQWAIDRSTRQDMVFFVIAAAEDDRVLGYIQVASVDRFNGTGDLGICIGPASQGHGIAAEACALLEQYLRGSIGLRKLTLRVLADNERAIRFYLKSGYREVGKLLRHHRKAGSFADVLLMERFIDA